MANKIVVVSLMCFVLAAAANARVIPENLPTIHRERFLCENTHEIARDPHRRSCFHKCVAQCPRDDVDERFNCELKCDHECSSNDYDRLPEEKPTPPTQAPEKENIEPKNDLYKSCYDHCEKKCASHGYAKCQKKCANKCSVKLHRRT